MTPFIVKNCTERIDLGIRGENEARPIVFDFAALGLKDFGDGTAVLLIKRAPDETAYPAAVTSQDGDTLTWLPTETDTYYKGYGKAELFWYPTANENELAKSIVFTTYLANDIGTPGTAPEPFDDWLEELTELAAAIAADALAAQRAQEAAETAQGAAEYAQGKAEDAQTAAETAQGLAEGAADRAEAAEGAILDLTATASVSNTTGTPAVTVNVTEAGGHKNMAFAFSGIKGETGAQGETGPQGPEGPEGPEGPAGQDGADGADGYSPTATVTKSGDTATITITDKNGTTTATVKDGTTPTVDAALSPTSENPVQNKVVTVEKADIITDTAQGNIASFPDGAAYPVLDLSVGIDPVQDLHGYANPWPAGGGKNLIQNTATTDTVNNVTFTVNADGTVSLQGTASANTAFIIGQINRDMSASYKATGCPSGGSSSTYRLAVQFRTSSSAVTTENDTGGGYSFSSTKEPSATIIRLSIVISSGTNTDGLVFKPMLRIAGNGDDTFAPYSNICPIQGWTGAEVKRTGVNIWDEQWEVGTINSTTGLKNDATNRIRSKNKCPIKGGEQYFAVTPMANNAVGGIFFYDANDTYLGAIYATPSYNNGLFTAPSNAAYFMITLPTSYGTTYNHDVSVNHPSTDQSYHAYNGTTYPITWPTAGTVYGGELDVTTGVLTVDRAMLDPSVVSWIKNQNYNTVFACRPNGFIQQQTTACITDRFVYKTLSDMNNNYGYRATDYLYVSVPNVTTKEDLITWLTQNNAQILYKITPLTYQLTPTQVSTLLGENNIWADTGSVSVTYRADTQRYIQKLTGSTEEDMVANVNIAANKYFMVGGNLYYSTQSIASGETIKPGTNCTATNMADALNALNV